MPRLLLLVLGFGALLVSNGVAEAQFSSHCDSGAVLYSFIAEPKASASEYFIRFYPSGTTDSAGHPQLILTQKAYVNRKLKGSAEVRLMFDDPPQSHGIRTSLSAHAIPREELVPLVFKALRAIADREKPPYSQYDDIRTVNELLLDYNEWVTASAPVCDTTK